MTAIIRDDMPWLGFSCVRAGGNWKPPSLAVWLESRRNSKVLVEVWYGAIVTKIERYVWRKRWGRIKII